MILVFFCEYICLQMIASDSKWWQAIANDSKCYSKREKRKKREKEKKEAKKRIKREES